MLLISLDLSASWLIDPFQMSFPSTVCGADQEPSLLKHNLLVSEFAGFVYLSMFL